VSWNHERVESIELFDRFEWKCAKLELVMIDQDEILKQGTKSRVVSIGKLANVGQKNDM